MPREVESRYKPTPPQRAFHNSKADVLGYGGAVGGGKSFAVCQWSWDLALKHPGIQILIARLEHASIIETTKRTMVEQVLPPEAIAGKKASQSEDWIDVYTGEPGVTSRLNFIGFTNPGKWNSSEIGALVIDQAEEVEERNVTQFIMRLRQRCSTCIRSNLSDCVHMPHRAALTFNPGHPGHWLRDWFIIGAAQTEFGWIKPELKWEDADEPFGSAEFIIAKPTDNPYLSRVYLQRLMAQKEMDKRRLVYGEWVVLDGSMFFDPDALSDYQPELCKPWKTGETTGNPSGGDPHDLPRIKLRADGPLAIWKPPVRKVLGSHDAHRYVVAVDVSSGGGADYTGIQVLDVEEFEQVAELQVKLDPDLAAVEAYRLACIYNGALIVPEVTGGWGATIVRIVQRLNLSYKGPLTSKPTLYQRVIGQNQRLDPDYSTKFGWDTSAHTRMLMLDALEEAIRERSLKLYGTRTHTELTHFARDERGRPAALSGRHDDLTISLAIGVFIVLSLPRELQKVRFEPHKALVSGTGY